MPSLILDYEQIRQFRDDGYLVLRGVLKPGHAYDLAETGQRLIETDIQQNRQGGGRGNSDGFRNCIGLDDAFVPLLTQPRILASMIQLLGANIQLVTSHLIYRMPDPPETSRSRRFPGWHRDIANTPNDLGHAHVPKMVIKCAYALSDLTHPDSGVTRVSPGSNRLKERLAIPKGRPDPENAVVPALLPGDALLFENRTWHAAGPVLTDQTRKMVMFGYGYRWTRPMDYMLQPESLMEKVDEAGRQLLGGSWQDEKTGHFNPGGSFESLLKWAEAHGVHPQVIDPQTNEIRVPSVQAA